MPGEWELLGRLALALALSAAIGLERELRQKSAGLRARSVGAALFSLGAYGFAGERSSGSCATCRASPPRSCRASASSAAG